MSADFADSRGLAALVAAMAAILLAPLSSSGVEFVLRRAPAAAAGTAGSAVLWCGDLPAEQATLAVAGPDGPVPARILWQRRGDPLAIVFETAGRGDTFTARLTAGGGALPDWTPRAGVLLETRSLPDGPVDRLVDVQKLWRQATNTQGRGLVPAIFDGFNRHGPTTAFLVRYVGWFGAPQDGRYEFATLSTDASFLLVDGRPVAEWPGWHGVEGGRHGQHRGAVQLGRGPHSIEYWSAQGGASGCAMSANWQPPGAARLEPMPASAFLPVAAFDVAAARGEGSEAAFGWRLVRSARAGQAAMVAVKLWRLNAEDPGLQAEWRLDDGTQRTGQAFEHVFGRTGLRQVELAMRRQGRVVARRRETVNVRPLWSQAAECPDSGYAEMRDRALGQALDRLPPDDAAGFVDMAERLDDAALLGKLGAAVLSRPEAFTGRQARVLHRLGFFYQRPAVQQYDSVTSAWHAVLADPAAPDVLRARTAVHLAGFLVHTCREVDEGLRLLDEQAPDAALSDEDRRLRTIFRADALVLLGRREAALAAYREAGTAVARADTDYEVRRRARIENARDFLRRKEYDAAEQVVRGLEWEWPLERLDLESGLLMVEVFRGRGENVMALGACRRLLAAAPADSRRPDLLLAAAEICRDLKRSAECRRLLAQLGREHPYSEAEARAKDRFPEEVIGQ
jgi:tetratricopeptide (TPR) repeat protein